MLWCVFVHCTCTDFWVSKRKQTNKQRKKQKITKRTKNKKQQCITSKLLRMLVNENKYCFATGLKEEKGFDLMQDQVWNIT